MTDTDAAGILYFANQFRIIHAVFEDFIEEHGIDFNALLFNKPYGTVIVHAESNYHHPLTVGDKLDITLTISHIGKSLEIPNLHKNKPHCIK